MTSAFDRILAGVGEAPGTAFLVAASGGADSAVAAAIVQRLAGEGSVRLIHLDHGLPASGTMADVAAKLARHLDLPLDRVVLEIGPGSWESTARKARLAALAAAAEPGELIVTGHHADDVAETTLGHLMRGAGARGLSSLRERSGRYWRPLHGVGRGDIRATADELGLPYADDPQNLDLSFKRNVIRHEMIPAMEQLNPRVREALARTAAHLGDDEDELERTAGQVPITWDRGAWVIPRPLLATLPRPVARRAIGAAVRKFHPPYGPSTAELGRLEAVLTGAAARTELASGVVAVREGPMLAIFRRGELPSPPKAVGLTVPGAARFGPDLVTATRALMPPRPRFGRAVLKAEAVGDDLAVRSPVPGDEVDVGGRSRPVRDMLRSIGVPERHRPGWPLVTAHGKIAWVVGARAAAWAGGATADVVVVACGRTGGWTTRES